MERKYSNQNHNEGTKFFIGNEVENTLAKGKRTLFIVGVQDPYEIIEAAKNLKCEAVYFGANHSFYPDDMIIWENMIQTVLDDPAMLLCTLDTDVKYVEHVAETTLVEHNNFIMMISVKMPYVQQYGYNAVVKIDDIDFEKTNPGVWCHNLHDLMKPDAFTHWSNYKDDKTI